MFTLPRSVSKFTHQQHKSKAWTTVLHELSTKVQHPYFTEIIKMENIFESYHELKVKVFKQKSINIQVAVLVSMQTYAQTPGFECNFITVCSMVIDQECISNSRETFPDPD